MKRREFITLLGSAAAWPLAAHAQQPAMPVIGFLSPTTREGWTERLRGFRQGLKDTGYVEGENVAIEYRWAEDQIDRLQHDTAEKLHHRYARTGQRIIVYFTSDLDPSGLDLQRAWEEASTASAFPTTLSASG